MNLPTKITVSRIFAVVLMLIALFVMYLLPDWATIELGNSGINLVFLIIFVFFLLASYTDHLDGHIARKYNLITDLGKFLDPIADKLLINSLLIFLTAPSIFAPYIPNASNILTTNVWCVIVMIGRDIVVDALRTIAASKNMVIAANKFGKAKTVLEMIAISFVLLNGWPFTYFDRGWDTSLRIGSIFVYLACAMSVISGIIYVIQNKEVFKSNKK